MAAEWNGQIAEDEECGPIHSVDGGRRMSQSGQSRTTLSDDEYARCLRVALQFIGQRNSIRNRQLRTIAGIGYDQAIRFFNRAIEENHLIRKGKGSGTYYTATGPNSER